MSHLHRVDFVSPHMVQQRYFPAVWPARGTDRKTSTTGKFLKFGFRTMFDDLEGLLAVPTPPDPLQNGPAVATEAQLATFWGVSARQVRMLVSEGVIAKSDAALFDVQAVTRSYLRHLMGKANRGATDPELKAEKLRLTREQADAVEIKNAAARGDLVAVSDVKSTWAGILRDLRTALLGLPSRIHARLPHLTPHDVKTIDSEIRDVLTELANGND